MGPTDSIALLLILVASTFYICKFYLLPYFILNIAVLSLSFMWYSLVINSILKHTPRIFCRCCYNNTIIQLLNISIDTIQDCSYKVSCVTSFKWGFQHVLMVLLFEKSRNSVHHVHAFKVFTGHIIIWHNLLT